MAKPLKLKSLKVVERKLSHKGKKYYGLAELDDRKATISVHPQQTAKEKLNTYIHEALHIGDWLCQREKDLNETEVNHIASQICQVLWKQGYRRTEIK
jgi:hypothetical protein